MEEKLNGDGWDRNHICADGWDGCNFCSRAGLYPGVNDILFKFVTHLFGDTSDTYNQFAACSESMLWPIKYM